MGLSLRPDHRWHSQANGMEPAVLIRNSQKTLYGLIWLGSFALVMVDYADGRRSPWGNGSPTYPSVRRCLPTSTIMQSCHGSLLKRNFHPASRTWTRETITASVLLSLVTCSDR